MNLEELLSQLNSAPNTVEFNDVISVIEQYYDYQATEFTNGVGDGRVTNLAGSNEGSCKIFSFAALNNLTEAQTLACFGQYYRDDVLKNSDGDDHQNIRNFIKSGWAGVSFEKQALELK